MNEGRIKFFNEEKGFGFIVPEIEGDDIFFHVTDLSQDVYSDDIVTYDTKNGTKGLKAVNITVVARLA